MKKYFQLEEATSSPHKFLIMPVHDNLKKFFKTPVIGRYGVLPARIMNLSYAQYCRFCRDVLGAELVGKNCKYLFILFQKTEEVQMFVRLLNKRMEFLEKEFDKRNSNEEVDLSWEID